MKRIVILMLVCFCHVAEAQESKETRWYNPLEAGFAVIEGRNWQTELDKPFDRLPAKAIPMVREPVMNLARNSAGTYLKFTTTASNISVRYQVEGGLQFPHMPATGVSGLDLYAIDKTGNWQWVQGRYSFGDTVRYNFLNIDASAIKEFRLYLPLYNTVRWLELGVAGNSKMEWIPVSKKAPVVLYGTSILQGACATRAGLAWTNILGRKLNTPLVNLGFSGNGRMEKEIIDMIAEQPAELVILDCIPNLSNSELYPKAELEKRYQYAITKLREKNSKLPIILTEHCCGLPGMNMDAAITKTQQESSRHVKEIFQQLKASGVRNIYLLSTADIGLDKESTVDGVHPNDIGMMKYALAYEKLIRRILPTPR